MQQPAIFAARDLAIGAARLFQGEIVGQRDDALQDRIVTLQTIEVQLGQFNRRDLFGANQRGELRDRPERDVFDVVRQARRFDFAVT